MNLPRPSHPADPPEVAPLEDGEDLVDISIDLDAPTDLQALADAIAADTPAPEDVLPAPAAEAPDAVEDLQRALDNALGRMRAMEEAQAELVEQHRRLAADFTNFRGRAGRDMQMAVDAAERRLLLEILPVLDNFERGLAASYPSLDALRGGVELIYKQFLDTLRRLGVGAIELKVGDPFDATHAEALTTTTSPDLPDHSVANVFERGFLLRDQLLRPARVVVNHLPEEHPPAPDLPVQ